MVARRGDLIIIETGRAVGKEPWILEDVGEEGLIFIF